MRRALLAMGWPEPLVRLVWLCLCVRPAISCGTRRIV